MWGTFNQEDFGLCINYAKDMLMKDFDGYVMQVASDQFIWRPFSIYRYLKLWDRPMAFGIETHNSAHHIHPSLLIFDVPNVPNHFWIEANFSSFCA